MSTLNCIVFWRLTGPTCPMKSGSKFLWTMVWQAGTWWTLTTPANGLVTAGDVSTLSSNYNTCWISVYFCCFISLIVLCMLLLNVCMIVLIYIFFFFAIKNLHCCLIHTCTKLVLHTFVCPPSDYPCQVDPLLKRLQDWSSRSTRERNSESSSTEVKNKS